MKIRSQGRLHRRSARGLALIEVLVAAGIVGINLAAMTSLWHFSYHMTGLIDDKGIACNLARQTMESIKQTGFTYTAEAPTASPVLHYFGTHQENLDAAASTARYRVSSTIISDTFSGGTPSPSALRTITITVTLPATGEVIYRTSSYLVRAGI